MRVANSRISGYNTGDRRRLELLDGKQGNAGQCNRFFPSQGAEDKQAPGDYFISQEKPGRKEILLLFPPRAVQLQLPDKHKQEIAYSNTCSTVPTVP